MGCCIEYDAAKLLIEQIAQQYHPEGYKLFIARRDAGSGITRKMQVGLVVTPDDDKNSQMFDAFIALGMRADSCIRMLYSQVDLKGTMMIDLFMLEISTEVVL